MKRFICCIPLAFAICVFAQTPQLKSGSTVFIEPMDGYETYLAAAIGKKHVPVVLVFDKSKAEFIITSTVSHHAPSSPAVIIENTNVNNSGGSDAFQNGMRMGAARSAARGATSASISVIDPHSSQVIFAYSVGKAGNTNQVQSAAEACAKHLKDFIEKSSK